MAEFKPIFNELMLLLAVIIVFIALDMTSIIGVLVLGIVVIIALNLIKAYGGMFV
jgi:maltodextrin utilization protein YvdJ